MMTQSKVDKSYKWLGIVVFAGLIVYGSVYAYWHWYPYEPITFHEVNLLTPVVRAGDLARVELIYTKKEYMPVTVEKFIKNETSAIYTDTELELSVGDHVRKIVQRRVPPNYHSGTYYVGSNIRYKPNPTDRIVYRSWQSTAIQVIGVEERGETGATGLTGKQGERGRPGKDAAAVPPAEDWRIKSSQGNR